MAKIDREDDSNNRIFKERRTTKDTGAKEGGNDDTTAQSLNPPLSKANLEALQNQMQLTSENPMNDSLSSEAREIHEFIADLRQKGALRSFDLEEIVVPYTQRSMAIGIPMERFMTVSPIHDVQPWLAEAMLEDRGIERDDTYWKEMRKEIASYIHTRGLTSSSLGENCPISTVLYKQSSNDRSRNHVTISTSDRVHEDPECGESSRSALDGSEKKGIGGVESGDWS